MVTVKPRLWIFEGNHQLPHVRSCVGDIVGFLRPSQGDLLLLRGEAALDALWCIGKDKDE